MLISVSIHTKKLKHWQGIFAESVFRVKDNIRREMYFLKKLLINDDTYK